VQIRVQAAGINPVETYIRSGNYARKPKLPFTPGKDCAGVVTKVGANVKNLKVNDSDSDFRAQEASKVISLNVKVGDRVYTVESETGTYAEYTVCPVKRVFNLSDNLNFLEGSAIGTPYFTAYRALILKGNAKPNETVLIHGASGAVGIGSIQLAKSIGLHVIGTAGTPEGLNMIKELGCDQVYNHRTDADYVEKIKQAYPNGVDIVLEMSSHTNLNKDLELLKFKRGRVVVIGCRGPIEINPRLIMAKESVVTGISLASGDDEDFESINAHLQSLMKLNAIKPVTAKIYKLEEAAQAHVDVITNSGTMGRLAFKLD
ncbi:unnamed protein product, partial [Sphagnum compactum]